MKLGAVSVTGVVSPLMFMSIIVVLPSKSSTLILYKDGEVLATKIGSVTKAQLVTFLDEHL